jgi:hypothetical protein
MGSFWAWVAELTIADHFQSLGIHVLYVGGSTSVPQNAIIDAIETFGTKLLAEGCNELRNVVNDCW